MNSLSQNLNSGNLQISIHYNSFYLYDIEYCKISKIIELKKLVHKYCVLKVRFTTFRSFSEDYSNEPNMSQLKLRYEMLHSCVTEFKDIQCDIKLIDCSD